MIIGEPRIEVGEEARVVFPVTSKHPLPHALWFSVERAFADLLAENSDAALVGLLMVAMRHAEDLHVSGPITDTLLVNAHDELSDLIERVTPVCRRIDVTADHPAPARQGGSDVTLAFSGGVDSLASLDAHLINAPVDSAKVTHLLFTNAGSHDPAGRPLYLDRATRLRPIGERLGVPFVLIDSNISDFYWDDSWMGTHVMRSVATAMAVSSGVKRFLHSASNEWNYVIPTADAAQSRAEPFLIPMLSSEGLLVTSVGGAWTRFEKIRRVAQLPLAREFLDVCTSLEGGGNCSRCTKCLFTMLALELVGELESFEGTFDLDAYYLARDDMLLSVFSSDRPLHLEFVEHARAAGLEPPRPSLAGAMIARLSRTARRTP